MLVSEGPVYDLHQYVVKFTFLKPIHHEIVIIAGNNKRQLFMKFPANEPSAWDQAHHQPLIDLLMVNQLISPVNAVDPSVHSTAQ